MPDPLSERTGALLLGGMLVLPGSPPVVYGAFTEPGLLEQWCGPEGFTVRSVDLTPEAGARYRIEMQPPDGPSFHVSGKLLTVAPPRRLAFTFAYEEATPDDVETVVRVTLNDLGGATAVRWEHGRFTTEARRALHRAGWAESLDKLESLLTA